MYTKEETKDKNSLIFRIKYDVGDNKNYIHVQIE